MISEGLDQRGLKPFRARQETRGLNEVTHSHLLEFSSSRRNSWLTPSRQFTSNSRSISKRSITDGRGLDLDEEKQFLSSDRCRSKRVPVVWRGSQVVRQGSAKALCVGSIPTLASKPDFNQ